MSNKLARVESPSGVDDKSPNNVSLTLGHEP